MKTEVGNSQPLGVDNHQVGYRTEMNVNFLLGLDGKGEGEGGFRKSVRGPMSVCLSRTVLATAREITVALLLSQ